MTDSIFKVEANVAISPPIIIQCITVSQHNACQNRYAVSPMVVGVGEGWGKGGGGVMRTGKPRDRVHDPKLLIANWAVAEMGPVNLDGCRMSAVSRARCLRYSICQLCVRDDKLPTNKLC